MMIEMTIRKINKAIIGNLLCLETYLKYTIKHFLKSLYIKCGGWKTFVLFWVVWLVMASPTWAGYILYAIFKWKWSLRMANLSLFFWNCIPCTPFVPICLGITLGIRKIFRKRIK